MTPNEIIDYCLTKTGAYLDYPFPNTVTVKVEKRIFAHVFVLKGVDTLTLKCDLEAGMFYRQLYPDVIVRGYHCPPIQQPYFNTMPINGVLSDEILLEMIDHSYKTTVCKLPKYVQQRLQEQEKQKELL